MFLHDLRYAARTLRRSSGFTIVAVLTLGLGIGASTAMFSLVNAVLIQPLPYPGADRLVVVKHTAPGLDIAETGQSVGTFVHYRERSRLFEHIGIYNENVVNLAGDVSAERIDIALVTPSVFAALGARPALGRLLLAEDAEAPTGVVISHDLWRRQYGADRGIIGRTIELNSVPRVVVGVLEPGVDFPRRETQVWFATAVDPASTDGVGLAALFYSSIGRLRPGAAIVDAESELNALIPSLADAYPDATPELLADAQLRAIVRPLKGEIVGDAGAGLWLVLGGTLLVLAIACANIANLFLIRGEHRQKELALRTALGATHGDIFRYSLGEGVVVAAVGCALGLLLADTAVQALTAFGPVNLPRLHEVAVDWWVVAFAASLGALAALLFGALPAVGHRRPDVTAVLKDAGRNTSSGLGRQRIRNLLVVSQCALALALLISSALLVQSFWRLNNVDPGFDASGVLTMEMALPTRPYPDYASRAALWHRVLEDVRAIPGVEAAGAVTSLPLTGSWIDDYLEDPVVAEGSPVGGGESANRVTFAAFTPGYLEAMRIPVVAGKSFQHGEPAGTDNPILVSAPLARRLFAGEPALGKRLRRADYDGRAWHTIVGVAGGVRRSSVAGEPVDVVYVPILDRAAEISPTHMSLAIRTSLPPLSVVPAVRRTVAAIDPALPIASVRTMERIVADSTARTSFTMLLLVVAAVGALFLGAVGVYGVVSYTVSRRTHEIGIRIALGARAADVGRMVLRQGLTVVGAGLAIGVAIALASSRLIRSLLFEVSPTDPWTIVAMALVLAAVALLACWLPTRRAARVDPLVALRSQ